MGIMDKIKRATGTDEQYDDIYDNEYYDGFDDYGDAGMDAQTQQVNMNQTQQGYAAPTGTGGMTGSAYTPRRILPRRRYVRGSFLLKHRRHKPFRKRDRDEGRKAGAF